MFELNTCYTKNSFLAPFVSSYALYTIELVNTPSNYVNRTFPKNRIYISFELNDSVFEIKHKNTELKKVAKGSYVSTYYSHYIDVYTVATQNRKKKSKLFVVEMFPYAFFEIFHVPIRDFSDEYAVPLVDLLGTSLMDQLINELSEASDIYEMVACFEEIFSFYIFTRNKPLHFLSHYMFSIPYNTSLASLSDILGYSSKWIENRYKEVYGYSFVQNKHLRRFNQAIDILNDAIAKKKPFLLTDVAHQCHYFDQSHFIKDFKKFTDMLPTEYIQKATQHHFINVSLHTFDDGRTTLYTFM